MPQFQPSQPIAPRGPYVPIMRPQLAQPQFRSAQTQVQGLPSTYPTQPGQTAYPAHIQVPKYPQTYTAPYPTQYQPPPPSSFTMPTHTPALPPGKKSDVQ